MLWHGTVIASRNAPKIVKTRQRRDSPRGLLNLQPSAEGGPVRLSRVVPTGRAASFVEHYWIVRWDLRGQPPFTSESLPYPSVHIVLERGDSRVQGVTTGKFAQRLIGQGMVFGIKFKPGGFRPLLDTSVATLTDRRIPLRDVLSFGDALEAAILSDTPVVEADAAMVERCDALLAGVLPEPDPQVAFLTDLVERVAADRTLVRVDQLLEQAGMSKRALERAFHDYVGVRPKWVIQRYRLFEAAERLANAASTGAALAQELGYFDQAHFIRDFKAIVGQSPKAYARSRA